LISEAQQDARTTNLNIWDAPPATMQNGQNSFSGVAEYRYDFAPLTPPTLGGEPILKVPQNWGI